MSEIAFDHCDPDPELSKREHAVLFETFVAHKAMLVAVGSMRENREIPLIQHALSAEHFLHYLKYHDDTLQMARKIADTAVAQSAILTRNVAWLSDRGIHYRGLSDEGGALVVVRRPGGDA